MRVLLTGGGTAGHINPALAIAETIKGQDPHAVIEFVGIAGGKEADLVPREGYRLHYVESMGIRRSLSLSNVKALWLALTSPYSRKTTKILEDFQPDIVIGTGGYACWPIMAAAARKGIPTALHESNALPGLAVRQLQGKVDRIWVNFERTKSLLKAQEKVVRVGNPLRGGFGAIGREEAAKKIGLANGQRLILSFGGSLGAEAVNSGVIEMMKLFSARHSNVLHVHAAGKRDFEATYKRFSEEGLDQTPNCRVVDYIYDMPYYMSAADLVICRAGAMTLSEIALLKKCSILIPSPYVADNHQYLNAKALADAGAALLVEEKDLTGLLLSRHAEALLWDKAKQSQMASAVTAFADPEANRRIWEEITAMVK